MLAGSNSSFCRRTFLAEEARSFPSSPSSAESLRPGLRASFNLSTMGMVHHCGDRKEHGAAGKRVPGTEHPFPDNPLLGLTDVTHHKSQPYKGRVTQDVVRTTWTQRRPRFSSQKDKVPPQTALNGLTRPRGGETTFSASSLQQVPSSDFGRHTWCNFPQEATTSS